MAEFGEEPTILDRLYQLHEDLAGKGTEGLTDLDKIIEISEALLEKLEKTIEILEALNEKVDESKDHSHLIR